jgi:stearoyl-CoA desaturase (delta-9 desaturase)
LDSVRIGDVRYAPLKSIWFVGMAGAAVLGGLATFRVDALLLFLSSTACVLLLGHSLGSHRKLIHDSYQCPKWLEYFLVYCGVQVGLAGPLGLMRQHELRDYAQRLPDCHDYLRHGRRFWLDAWWQLNCELRLANPPAITIEPRIARDLFYRFLERTWMAQQLPWAIVFYLWGGWAYVFWGTCARVTAGVFGHWLIGYFAHNRGGMRYRVAQAAVQGRNIPFTSLLTMGECWHNNHHAFPGSARLGLHPGEWDPGWWLLMLLRRAGLVWDMRLPRDLPARPELEALRACSSPSRPNEPFIEAPLATALSIRVLQAITGRSIALWHNPHAARLSLHMEGTEVRGLPALCLAFARRNGAARMLALCLLPIASAFEKSRTALDLE